MLQKPPENAEYRPRKMLNDEAIAKGPRFLPIPYNTLSQTCDWVINGQKSKSSPGLY